MFYCCSDRELASLIVLQCAGGGGGGTELIITWNYLRRGVDGGNNPDPSLPWNVFGFVCVCVCVQNMDMCVRARKVSSSVSRGRM